MEYQGLGEAGVTQTKHAGTRPYCKKLKATYGRSLHCVALSDDVKLCNMHARLANLLASPMYAHPTQR